MRSVMLILVEVALLAVAQVAGGPPWTVLTAVAVVLQSAAGLTAGGLARLAGAFVWLALFRVTGDRELFFCFAMTLAAHLAMLFAARRWTLGIAAGGLIVAVFLGFRVSQQATFGVLAVEAAVAVAILVGVLVAERFVARSAFVRSTSHDSPQPALPVAFVTDTAIVMLAAAAAYAGLAL